MPHDGFINYESLTDAETDRRERKHRRPKHEALETSDGMILGDESDALDFLAMPRRTRRGARK